MLVQKVGLGLFIKCYVWSLESIVSTNRNVGFHNLSGVFQKINLLIVFQIYEKL